MRFGTTPASSSAVCIICCALVQTTALVWCSHMTENGSRGVAKSWDRRRQTQRHISHRHDVEDLNLLLDNVVLRSDKSIWKELRRGHPRNERNVRD